MYKKIRKSVADAIANVDNPDQFEWNKWLREPQIYLEKFPKPRVDVKNIDCYKSFSNPSLYQVKNFSLSKIKISSALKHIVVRKNKSYKIFFSFAKTLQRKINLFDPNAAKLNFILSTFYENENLFLHTITNNNESTVSLNTECFEKNIEEFEVRTNSKNVKLDEIESFLHDFGLSKPEKPVIDIKLPSKPAADSIQKIEILTTANEISYAEVEFKKLNNSPDICNIPVSSVEEIKQQLQESEQKQILSFPINPLPEKVKQFKVKLLPLEKIRVPLYHLKNLRTKEAKLGGARLKLLQEAEINGKNLKIELPLGTKIFNPEISSYFLIDEQKSPIEVTAEEPVLTKKSFESIKSEQKIDDLILEAVEGSFESLHAQHKEGMRFLLNNKKAVLCDELGTDSKTQIVCAVVAAIRMGLIRNALIVCSDPHIGNKKVAGKIPNSQGWENQFLIWGPELSISTVKLGKEVSQKLRIENSHIHLTTYDTLLDESYNSQDSRLFPEVDCLVFDEAQNILAENVKHEQLLNFPHSKFLWLISGITTGIIKEKLIPVLENHLPGFEQIDNLLIRSKNSLRATLPDVVRQDYWLEFNKEQEQEFDNIITQGRKRIIEVVQSGNPFIIQSNIFTLLHQIKQIENFSTHQDMSPKAELLIEHLESILANGQKTIIFSQYDKQGVQKIERLLKANNIRYALYQSGMPLKELENSVNSFKKESKINVMVAGLTAASIKVRLAEAPYFIHFDQWWNPINQWQYEDKASNSNSSNDSSNHLSVFNYFTNNTVGINIRETLQRKGLLNKNLIDGLSNEVIYSLVSNEDWLDILEIEHPKSRKNALIGFDKIYNEIRQMKSDQLGPKIKSFFTKLGYKNLMLKPDTINNFSIIYGSISKGNNEIRSAILFIPFDVTNTDHATKVLEELLKNNNRVVVICSSEAGEKLEIRNSEKMNIIDPEMLAKYFTLFKVS